MSQKGNTMITMMFTAGPDATTEGDRLYLPVIPNGW